MVVQAAAIVAGLRFRKYLSTGPSTMALGVSYRTRLCGCTTSDSTLNTQCLAFSFEQVFIPVASPIHQSAAPVAEFTLLHHLWRGRKEITWPVKAVKGWA